MRDAEQAPGAENLIRDVTVEIGRADAKAGVLFTGTGIVLSVATSLLVAARPQLAELPLRFQIPLLISVAGAALALGTIGLAVYPRGVHRRMLEEFGPRPGLSADDAVRLARRLSLIAYRKYRYIKMAFAFFALPVAGALAVAAETIIGR